MNDQRKKTPPPNLRQVQGCCGSCRHYAPGYDIGTCRIHNHASGPAFVEQDETCDDWTAKDNPDAT